MNRPGKNRLILRILFLVVLPVLTAAVLLSLTEKKDQSVRTELSRASRTGADPAASGTLSAAAEAGGQKSGISGTEGKSAETKDADAGGPETPAADADADAEEAEAPAADADADAEEAEAPTVDADADAEEAEAPTVDADADADGEEAADAEAGSEEEFEEAGEEAGPAEDPAAQYSPLQELSFTADMEVLSGQGGEAEKADAEGDVSSRQELRRSVPVQISAEVLGEDPGTVCQAVFLPAEMADGVRILFSKYESVSFEPFGQDSPGAEARVYASGDRVSGLTNGSIFRVRMRAPDGTEQTGDLHVFSCTGTATMYLDTESGSMEKVDADLQKETSEQASFIVCLPDGRVDSEGECKVSGRGNSSWRMKKRPYNLNLTEKQSVLGMGACKKLCLLANVFDPTNLLDRISAQLALGLGMRDTPQGEFVNLYLNGRYNGLYYLSQRPRTGGSVNIDKLDNQILKANRAAGDSALTEDDVSAGRLPKRVALHQNGDKRKKWAYNWPSEPEDNSGGYLLQQYSRYEGDGCWFSTDHRRYRIMSPSYPTPGQVTYLSDYMLAAERAIYSEDGVDPETGKQYEEFLDLPSWEDMFLLEEYFAEWDAERWSFYIIKDKGDPLLYCGPMWDFDHSAGTMIYGTYPETAVSMLLFRDTRHGWMYKLLSHESFVSELHDRWRDRFSPAVREFLENRMETEIAAIESSARMNDIRRGNLYDFREKTDELTKWLRRRVDFLDSFCRAEEQKASGEKAEGVTQYCRVEFVFTWGSLSHYVPAGESLGYLPLPEYGETQTNSQIRKQEIIGWKDEEEQEIGPDIVIDKDRVFTPIYR